MTLLKYLLYLLFIIIIIICVWEGVGAGKCVNVCYLYRDAEEPRRASDLLELELPMVVSCLVWLPGVKLRSSGRAAMLLTREPSLWPLS